ncbi:hypothetical protein ACIA8R_52810, partial [Nonomuraea sp. NPDC051191]|uniref:hypothetical protein n=1 Tax=Nonomuraea sp. NPDC051191 TaxID=3364372 RepID=UPI0037974050
MPQVVRLTGSGRGRVGASLRGRRPPLSSLDHSDIVAGGFMEVGLFYAHQLPDTTPADGFDWDMQV